MVVDSLHRQRIPSAIGAHEYLLATDNIDSWLWLKELPTTQVVDGSWGETVGGRRNEGQINSTGIGCQFKGIGHCGLDAIMYQSEVFVRDGEESFFTSMNGFHCFGGRYAQG